MLGTWDQCVLGIQDDEFVLTAKTRPDEVKDPSAYVKK